MIILTFCLNNKSDKSSSVLALTFLYFIMKLISQYF